MNKGADSQKSQPTLNREGSGSSSQLVDMPFQTRNTVRTIEQYPSGMTTLTLSFQKPERGTLGGSPQIRPLSSTSSMSKLMSPLSEASSSTPRASASVATPTHTPVPSPDATPSVTPSTTNRRITRTPSTPSRSIMTLPTGMDEKTLTGVILDILKEETDGTEVDMKEAVRQNIEHSLMKLDHLAPDSLPVEELDKLRNLLAQALSICTQKPAQEVVLKPGCCVVM